jgi:hypothetical protein
VIQALRNLPARLRRMGAAHPFLFCFFLLSLFCLLLLFLFPLFPAFSQWFSRYPAAFFRGVTGGISSLFPFSLFEAIIALFILFCLILIPLTLWALCRRRKPLFSSPIKKAWLAVFLVLLSVLDLFALNFASSYHRPPVAEQMALSPASVQEEEVFSALEQVIAVIRESAEHLTLNEAGESIAPAWDECKESVRLCADAFAERNPFLQGFGFSVKRFLVSPWMTYTHIAGVFGFLQELRNFIGIKLNSLLGQQLPISACNQ